MVQFLERNDSPSFGQRFARGVGSVAQHGIPMAANMLLQREQQMGENAALKRLTGQDLGGLSPDLKSEFVKATLKQQGTVKGKPEFESAILALDELESMVDQPGIGMSGILNPSSSARFNRGRFQSLQAAVLPIFKSMFPRGMTEKEFKFIQENYIPQASDTEQKIKGKIEGLRRLVQSDDIGRPDSMDEFSEEEGEPQQQRERVKFDIRNPQHKARRDQVLRKTGGDQRKAQQVLLKEFDL